MSRATDGDRSARLEVRVFPRSRHDAIDGRHDGRVRVRLTAPPVDGKANSALLRLLASELSLRRSQLRIESGETHRDKAVRVDGLDEVEVLRRLGLE